MNAIGKNGFEVMWIVLNFHEFDQSQGLNFINNFALELNFGQLFNKSLIHIIFFQEISSRIGLHIKIGQEYN